MRGEIINMSLYAVYFDAILRGAKTTEYRDFSDYWIGKLVDKAFYNGMTAGEIKDALTSGRMPLKYNNYKYIRFWNKERNMLVEVKDVKVHKGHSMFAIKLGNIIEKNI